MASASVIVKDLIPSGSWVPQPPSPGETEIACAIWIGMEAAYNVLLMVIRWTLGMLWFGQLRCRIRVSFINKTRIPDAKLVRYNRPRLSVFFL